MARIPTIAISSILGLVVLACGGSTAPTAIPASTVAPMDVATLAAPPATPTLAATAPPPAQTPASGSSPPVRPPTIAPVADAQEPGETVSNTADILTERVEDALDLASRGNWLEAWEYYTLSFRESCPRETFAAQAASGMNMFRSMLEIPIDESLEFRLMDVTVIGSTALVSTHIFHRGEPLDYGAQDELDSWVRIDGEWWNNVPPGPEGCVN